MLEMAGSHLEKEGRDFTGNTQLADPEKERAWQAEGDTGARDEVGRW